MLYYFAFVDLFVVGLKELYLWVFPLYVPGVSTQQIVLSQYILKQYIVWLGIPQTLPHCPLYHLNPLFR